MMWEIKQTFIEAITDKELRPIVVGFGILFVVAVVYFAVFEIPPLMCKKPARVYQRHYEERETVITHRPYYVSTDVSSTYVWHNHCKKQQIKHLLP